MTEKIELRLDLRSLVCIWSRYNDLHTCNRILDLQFYGRYVSPPNSNTRHPFDVVTDLRRCLNNRNELFNARLATFKRKFNNNVELVFVGKTERGRALFKRLEDFLGTEPTTNIPLWK